MSLMVQSDDQSVYLARTPVIDFDDPEIIALSERLNQPPTSEIALVQAIYEFVRDNIAHSNDINGKMVTCAASQVLAAGEGICFAKSHLMAALCRANNIPAGFCYQLLRLGEDDSKLILHGLNGVYLKKARKWIRLDARGNKPGVDAQFSLDHEQLAFAVRPALGEVDYLMIFADPDPNVINALTHYTEFNDLWANLPLSLSQY